MVPDIAAYFSKQSLWNSPTPVPKTLCRTLHRGHLQMQRELRHVLGLGNLCREERKAAGRGASGLGPNERNFVQMCRLGHCAAIADFGRFPPDVSGPTKPTQPDVPPGVDKRKWEARWRVFREWRARWAGCIQEEGVLGTALAGLRKGSSDTPQGMLAMPESKPPQPQPQQSRAVIYTPVATSMYTSCCGGHSETIYYWNIPCVACSLCMVSSV